VLIVSFDKAGYHDAILVINNDIIVIRGEVPAVLRGTLAARGNGTSIELHSFIINESVTVVIVLEVHIKVVLGVIHEIVSALTILLLHVQALAILLDITTNIINVITIDDLNITLARRRKHDPVLEIIGTVMIGARNFGRNKELAKGNGCQSSEYNNGLEHISPSNNQIAPATKKKRKKKITADGEEVL